MTRFFPRSLRLMMWLALLAGLTAGAQAIVFDWDASYGTWTGGSPGTGNSVTQNYNSDTSHTGNDVSITVANANANNSGFSWNNGYPKVDNSSTTGGLSPAQKALQFQVQDNNATGIVVTIDFSQYAGGVKNVSFTLWDIDKDGGSFIDQISDIKATTTTGSTVAATSVTGSASNQVTGSGLSYVINGTSTNNDTSAGGNATITFNTNNIKSITFTWKNADAGQSQQFIALHDITYTPMPEVGSSVVALGLCGGVAGYGFLGRTRRRRV